MTSEEKSKDNDFDTEVSGRDRSASFTKKNSGYQSRAKFIPDEYYQDNSKFCVHIFHGKLQKDNLKDLKNALESLKFKVSTHDFKSKKAFFKKLKECELSNDTEGVLIILLTEQNEEEIEKIRGIIYPDPLPEGIEFLESEKIEIKEVWSEFLNNQFLNGKPKIFLIHTYFECTTQLDFSGIDSRVDTVCDIPPPGADFLLIYHTTEDLHNEFLPRLSKLIREESGKYHLLDLVTFAAETDEILMVTTLRRKLYFKDQQFRGVLSDISQSKEESKMEVSLPVVSTIDPSESTFDGGRIVESNKPVKAILIDDSEQPTEILKDYSEQRKVILKDDSEQSKVILKVDSKTEKNPQNNVNCVLLIYSFVFLCLAFFIYRYFNK